MSLSVTVAMRGAEEVRFLITATLAPARRVELHRVMGERLAEELKEHFQERNKEPNAMNAPKTGFWNEVAANTGLASADADGAVVTVAERRFRLHYYGGTVVPLTAKVLTIPPVPAARGKRARTYPIFNTYVGKPLIYGRFEGC